MATNSRPAATYFVALERTAIRYSNSRQDKTFTLLITITNVPFNDSLYEKMPLLHYRSVFHNSTVLLILFPKWLVSLTLKMDLMAGIGLAQRLITSRPTVTTRQLATEDSLPINRGIGGLEEPRTDPLRLQKLEPSKEMDHKGHLLLLSLPSRVTTFHS